MKKLLFIILLALTEIAIGAVKIAPNARLQYVDSNGDPCSGCLLYTYVAGSTTAQNTYTDSTGGAANTNPIVLNSSGFTPSGVWLTEGETYKFVLKTAADVTIWTEDNVSGVNDSSTDVSEWVSSGLTPTFVSSTQFTVPGDQTTELHVGRRLLITDSGGTDYGSITASSYSAPNTTITVSVDGGEVIDSGISAFSYSILSSDNSAVPSDYVKTDEAQTISADHTLSGDLTISGANTVSGVQTFTAVPLFPNDTIETADIQDDAVTAAKLANAIAPRVLLSDSGAISGAATQDFDDVFSATYDVYEIELLEVIPATDAGTLYMRLGASGSTYDSGASDYGWGLAAWSTGGAATAEGDAADTEIHLTRIGLVGSDTNENGVSGIIRVYKPTNTTQTRIQNDVLYATAAAGVTERVVGSGARLSAASMASVRFLFASGNIESGRIRVYGLTNGS